MAKLSDTQLVLLSNAAKRDDSAVAAPSKLKGPSAEAVEALLSRKLCKAIPRTGQLPLWKHRPNGEPLSLVITAKGLSAIGIDPEAERVKALHPGAQTKQHADKRKSGKAHKGKAARPAKRDQQPGQRADTKIAKVVDLLRKPTGSTIKTIMSATGWQAHSVRGAISGAIKKKMGLKVASEVRGDERFYRISV
jgi:hypothetical protein